MPETESEHFRELVQRIHHNIQRVQGFLDRLDADIDDSRTIDVLGDRSGWRKDSGKLRQDLEQLEEIFAANLDKGHRKNHD